MQATMSSPGVVQVVQLLCAAADGDARVRVPAHQHLQELESRPGFISVLLEAYADSSAEPQGRLLAILMSKNVVDRQWQQRGASRGILPEEKSRTKEALIRLVSAAAAGALPHLVELVMVLRKVCRFEFPKQWDELARFLLSELQQIKEQGFSERTVSIVMVLHGVLKEQGSKKMLAARKELHQIGQLLAEPVGAVWCAALEHMQQRQAAELVDDRLWKLSRYLDGCFLILLAQGFPHLHEAATGPDMIVLVKRKVAFLVSLLRGPAVSLEGGGFFLKDVKSVLKWWSILIKEHPLAFTKANVQEVLHMSVEVMQLLAAPGAHAAPGLRTASEPLLRSCAQMLTHSFNTVAFRKGPQPKHEGAVLEAAKVCHTQFMEFAQRHSVDSLCSLCCHTALELSCEEVREWLADPEDSMQGPCAVTDLHIAGEALVRALGHQPFDQALIQHVARRMEEEAAHPPTAGEAFEATARRDSLLVLLALCQPQLRPHLRFEQLMVFFGPVVAMAPHFGKQCPSMLLAVRLCSVIRSWCGDIPQEALMPVLQLLHDFMQDGRPKALRLAALAPLGGLLERFSDHEAWAEIQCAFVDACMSLLGTLKAPDVQWRCLNIVHRFLRDEAESGRYEVTARSLQQLMVLWRQPDQGELLICHALVDVLQALVLMSCRSKTPRLPLSEPLLGCCLAVVSDCYSKHREAPASEQSEVSAALMLDAVAAMGKLGEMASATLFDAGSMLLLGVLRTVDLGQAAPLLGFFPQLVQHYSGQPSVQDATLDILLEFCALYVEAPGGAAQLQPHYGALLAICRIGIQAGKRGRSCELSFQVLQLLATHAQTPDNLRELRETVASLFQLWAATFNPAAGQGEFPYPAHAVLGLLGAWQAHRGDDFRQQAKAIAAGTARVAALTAACLKLARTAAMRVSLLCAALALLEEDPNGASGVDRVFWKDFLQCCGDIVNGAQKKAGGAAALLMQTLQALRPSTSTRPPVGARSFGELQRCLLPAALGPAVREDGSIDELAAVQWFFGHCAGSLSRLGARGGLDVQALIAGAPPQVQTAFRALGL